MNFLLSRKCPACKKVAECIVEQYPFKTTQKEDGDTVVITFTQVYPRCTTCDPVKIISVNI